MRQTHGHKANNSRKRPYEGNDLKRWADGISAKDFIEKVAGFVPEVTRYVDPTIASGVGSGCDATSAYVFLGLGLPGARGYNDHLVEYRQNPKMFFNRLWMETQKKIFASPEVTKRYLPGGRKELRLILGPDPEELKQRETDKYTKQQKKKGDFSTVKLGESSKPEAKIIP